MIDGRNKRAKAAARAKHADKRCGFYFDPPYFIKRNESGCICIDNKGQFCLKYAIACADHLRDIERYHPNRHKQYEQYLTDYDYKGMNFPA